MTAAATTTGRQQVSAIERLRSLPAILRGRDLSLAYDWSSKTVSQYLYLWSKRGLVTPLGGHSDVFANLIAQPQPDWSKALRMAFPSATIMGIEALREAGWSTQIPARPTVAVSADGPDFAINHFDVCRRPAPWFATVEFVQPAHPQPEHPRVLSPAWALADLLRTQQWGEFGLHPDDIDWDIVSPEDEEQWARATWVFGMPQVDLMSMAIGNRESWTPERPGG